MAESPLYLTLIAEERPGQFMLTCGNISYPIEFRPETDVSLGDLLRRLPPILVGGQDSSGQLVPLELLREIGSRLWQALLPDSAPSEERIDLVHDLRTGLTPLMLTVPQSLATLPWELLCDPELSGSTGFLALQRPLVRLVSDGRDMQPFAPPLRVLLLISSPPELDERRRVDVESERAAVEQATQAFREAGLLHLFVEDIVTLRRVQQDLLRFKPHIVHYIGHGGYDEDLGGILEWEDDQGKSINLLDRDLASMLRPRGLRAVLLHGCETAMSSRHTDFRGVAGALIESGIPAVMAQQVSFTYESSQRSSEMFYTALTSGLGLAEATFEVRQALAQAERPDWAVPRLQATTSCLLPLLDQTVSPGIPDPALQRHGAAADLPAPTGVFVGRQHELRELRTMLENPPDNGPVLALITGPGGVGKSTLAAQAVTRYGGRYKGTLTLRCAGYQGMDLFLQQIGEFLQRQGTPGLLTDIVPDAKLSIASKIDAAVEILNQAGPFLLLVDNLESVQNEDRSLSDPSLLLLLQRLLTNLHGGRVLITGRYAVENLLPLGKFEANLLRLDLDDLSGYETRQLLARYPSLAQLSESERTELVREFGGLPYVYDLLSSQAASRSLGSLIHDVQGRITQERAQRSAREWEQIRGQVVEFAALASTVARLSEQSRTLLGKLSLFRSSFPLQALEQGLSVNEVDWKPLLDWALLRFDPVNGHYHLHSLTAHYAQDLLDGTERITTQVQLAEWYLHYGREESHDLSDYLEAHRLLRAAGEVERAGELAMDLGGVLSRFGLYQLWRQLCRATIDDAQSINESLVAQAQHQLGMIAYQQGDYEEARRLYGEVLTIKERLGDQSGRASTLHQLGMIAQNQGDYEEARRLYAESLTIKERLGDQSGRASTLHALGVLAHKQHDYQAAIQYTALALTIFESLRSPSSDIALRELAKLRSELGESAFALLWHNTMHGQPFPGLPVVDRRQVLIDGLISFIQTKTWTESQQMLETHPEFLSTEADALLEQMAAAQQDDGLRQLIEDNRNLLRLCRNWGIEPALYFTHGMRLGDSIEIPQEHETAIQHIATLLSQQQADETALERAIEAMQSLLDSLSTGAGVPPLFEAALLRDLADAIGRLPADHPARNLEQMEGYYRKALLAYQEVDRPLSVLFVHRALASVLTVQGRYEEALEPLQAAITGLQEYEEYKEEVVWAHSEYANDLDNMGRTEAALAAYAKAIDLLPDSAALYRNRAETLIHARQLDEAEADLEHAIQLDGNEDSLYLWYRRAQLAIARGDSPQAQQMLNELLKRDDSFDVGWLTAQVAWLQGDLQAAQESLQNAWEKANAVERSSMHRDMECLFDEYGEVVGRNVLENIMQ